MALDSSYFFITHFSQFLRCATIKIIIKKTVLSK